MDGDKVNISALKADKTPEIDGSLADDVWKGGFVTYTDESYGKPLQFKFVWDDDNLYLAAKMIDVTPFCNTDKIFKDEAGAAADAAYSFQYDCLEFYFSGKNTEGEYADDDVQFIFTYQTDGAPALRVGGAETRRKTTPQESMRRSEPPARQTRRAGILRPPYLGRLSVLPILPRYSESA